MLGHEPQMRPVSNMQIWAFPGLSEYAPERQDTVTQT